MRYWTSVNQRPYGTVMKSAQSSISKSGRDDKRVAILGITYRAFLAEGYAATSMSAIATQVGGSKATLYSYFPSKEDLFAAVIEKKSQEVAALLFEVEENAADFGTALTQLGERLLKFLLEDESIATYRLITAEAGRFPELGRSFYQYGPQRNLARLAQYFDRSVAEGNLKLGNTTMMAVHFLELCRGDLHHRRLWNLTLDPSEAEIQLTVAQGINAFLTAYGAGQ